VTACDFAVGHLKAHPECSNKDIQEAAAVAGIKAYPNAISEARKKAGLPAARGRKPGVKNKVIAKSSKATFATGSATKAAEPRLMPVVTASRILSCVGNGHGTIPNQKYVSAKELELVRDASVIIGGFGRLSEVVSSLSYVFNSNGKV